MFYSDNPVNDAERYLAELDKQEEEWRSRLPVCSECGEHIEEDFCWDIEGELYCPDCADTLFCHCTENYMKE